MPHKHWILHIDMDAFFASVEQLDYPELQGKPVIIGGAERGVVSTASYEARKYGVHSAMPSFQARKLCPHGIFLSGRMWRYKEKSQEIFNCLQKFSPLIEQASIDEAYLDLTGLERIFGPVEELARRIQRNISEETGLSCSVGLAPGKFLAKIASDINKPNGVSILTHEETPAFLTALPIERIPGVGKATYETLQRLGVIRVGDMLRYPEDFWKRKLGKMGILLFQRAQGIDNRPVEPENICKSESTESTLTEDTLDKEILSTWLLRQAERVSASLRKQDLMGRTITLKVKYADFTQITRSRTLKEPTNGTRRIYKVALELFTELSPSRPLRLIGVRVSHFGEEEQQLSLFESEKREEARRDTALDSTIDQLRGRFGNSAIIRGKLFE